MKLKYSMLIQWSDVDKVYVVTLPEFGGYCRTHGRTYEEAARRGQEVLELLADSPSENGREPLEPVTLQVAEDLWKEIEKYSKKRRPSKKSSPKRKTYANHL